jgi:hypothetical protein
MSWIGHTARNVIKEEDDVVKLPLAKASLIAKMTVKVTFASGSGEGDGGARVPG